MRAHMHLYRALVGSKGGAIGLAIILFGEQHDVTPRFYAGVTIIVAAVVAYPVMARRT